MVYRSSVTAVMFKKEENTENRKGNELQGDKDSDTSLKKPPKKRVKRSTKDAICSKTKKEWKKLLKESRENPDSESDDYDADIDAPSVEVESNDNFSSSDDWDWEHYSEFDDDSDDDSSDSDWIM